MYQIQSSHPQLKELSIPETIRGMSTSFRRKDFWDHLNGQSLLVIG